MSEEIHERSAEGGSEEQVEIRGTLFLTTVLLILIFGFWVMMYVTMINL